MSTPNLVSFFALGSFLLIHGTAAISAESEVIPGDVAALRSPLCIKKAATKTVCRLSADEIQKQEQAIIDLQWKNVSKAVAALKNAELLKPRNDWPSGHPDDRPYETYCESLRQDLLNGRFEVFRKPDVSSSRDGVGKLVEGFQAVEGGCSKRLSQLMLKGYSDGYDGSLWLHRLSDGFGEIWFDLPTSSYGLDYHFHNCHKGNRLPVWQRKGKNLDSNRTDVLGMSVIDRGGGLLVALEYLEVHGFGDGYLRSSYGSVLQPEPVWAPSPEPERRGDHAGEKSGRPAVKKTGEPYAQFLGASMAPPPWQALYGDEALHDSGFAEPYEPCVWKLPD